MLGFRNMFEYLYAISIAAIQFLFSAFVFQHINSKYDGMEPRDSWTKLMQRDKQKLKEN